MSATDIVELRRAGARVSFTDPQLNLINRTICRPKKREATTDELSLFVGQCVRTGLDPFSKQIYAIFRWSSREQQEVMTVQTAIDGFRVIAERTGSYMGKVSTHWCGEDEEWKEVWLAKEPPAAAKVLVRKHAAGHVVEIPAVAHWAEYADDKGMWKDMPANQLAKCAEALALRQAFPNDLSGLYTTDEMAQADSRPSAPAVERTTAGPIQHREPEDATVVEDPMSSDDQAALVAEFDEAKVPIEMFLTAAGVDSTDDLTVGDGEALREKLALFKQAATEARS